ncbi:MAG: gamma-glutamyl-gamma-aminobutyrate hydrolase family protein [Candidatus Schekmanbacteria bacterium]|nr:gamma-glutamyl-gamma-aminobutyrate hydrolase family protein [Candidatus Schekmanbacteria bacterium]
MHKTNNIIIFQHIACEDLGTAANILKQRGLKLRYIRLYAGEAPPVDYASAAGFIFLGGPMNVYQEWEYPCLKLETEILQEAIRVNKPTLGICLGAQLIAKAAGAKVYAGRQKEIGWYPLHLTAQAQQGGLLAGFDNPLTVFQWHGDTFDLPDKAVSLASSTLFPQQAFSLGGKIYAFQFHLEVGLAAIEDWLREYDDELKGIYTIQEVEKIRRVSRENIMGLENLAQTVFSRFADLVLAED